MSVKWYDQIPLPSQGTYCWDQIAALSDAGASPLHYSAPYTPSLVATMIWVAVGAILAFGAGFCDWSCCAFYPEPPILQEVVITIWKVVPCPINTRNLVASKCAPLTTIGSRGETMETVAILWMLSHKLIYEYPK